jgi:hypothetical protein
MALPRQYNSRSSRTLDFHVFREPSRTQRSQRDLAKILIHNLLPGRGDNFLAVIRDDVVIRIDENEPVAGLVDPEVDPEHPAHHAREPVEAFAYFRIFRQHFASSFLFDGLLLDGALQRTIAD